VAARDKAGALAAGSGYGRIFAHIVSYCELKRHMPIVEVNAGKRSADDALILYAVQAQGIRIGRPSADARSNAFVSSN
jgi:hypothetical protein